MAIGLPPKYVEKIILPVPSSKESFVYIKEAMRRLNWRINFTSATGFIAGTNDGLFSNNEITIKIDGQEIFMESKSTGNGIFDMGRNKNTLNGLKETLDEVISSSLNQEQINLQYEEIKKDMLADEDDWLKLPPESPSAKIKNFFSLFKPSEGFFVTPIIVNLNLLVFLLMIISGVSFLFPDSESLVKWGANFRPVTLEGQWWRLLTSCFLHIGILHLLLNMYALIYIGLLLEPILGKLRFISAYLLTGIISSVASLWWHELTVSAGASGAIFGMYGVFLALLTTNLIDKNVRTSLLSSMTIFIAYNLMNGMRGNIDNAAHIGGLLSGVVIGYAFFPGLKNETNKILNYGIIIALIVLMIIGTTFTLKNTTSDIGTYEARIKDFSRLESIALELYNLPETTPKDSMLFFMEFKGIASWKASLRIINDLRKLDLPPELQGQIILLDQYCNLRLKCYELIYDSMKEDSDKHNKQIEDYSQQIEAVLKKLNGE